MAAEVRTLLEVLKVDSPEGWHWAAILQLPSGLKFVHTFPPDAIEWRAAEYDLDPDTDFDTIMDIILHELYVPDPLNPLNHADDAAAAQGMTSLAPDPLGAYVASGDEVPTHLYNAETVDKAKEALLARVEHVKANKVKVVKPTPVKAKTLGAKATAVVDPLDVVRADKQIDPDRMQQKRDLVASLREEQLAKVGQRRVMRAMTSAAPRAASKPLPPSRLKPPIDDTLSKRGNT